MSNTSSILETNSQKPEVVGLPRKGRNAGYALTEELPWYDTDEMIDLLNGRGKEAAKTGKGLAEILEKTEAYDFIEPAYTERKYPRPVFTNLELSGKTLNGYRGEAMDRGFDKFYQSLDNLVENNPNSESFTGMEDQAAKIAREKGYSLEGKIGPTVKWGVMSNDLSKEPEEILIPEGYTSIGKAVSQKFWGQGLDYNCFEDYGENQALFEASEEEILSNSPGEVAGVYMFVSGSTAREHGLEYRAVEGFKSALGVFQAD